MDNGSSFKNEIKKIIINGDAAILVEKSREIAGRMIERKKNGDVDNDRSVSASQIRNIYGASKKIEMHLSEGNAQDMYRKLILLKPKMAYAEGRHNKNNKIKGFRVFIDCLSDAIDQIEGQYDRMNNFFNFFEAILAYHKAQGGK